MTTTTVFHLDAGETLLKGFFSNKENSAKDRALLIGELSIDVGVDVWTVGPSDLMAVGMETLQAMNGPSRISATWKDDDGVLYFQPYKYRTKQYSHRCNRTITHPTDPRFQFIQTTPAKDAITETLPPDS